jgi:hypothetical protein
MFRWFSNVVIVLEAAVWVIAETNDLPTKFDRIVVTDNQGRYDPSQ